MGVPGSRPSGELSELASPSQTGQAYCSLTAQMPNMPIPGGSAGSASHMIQLATPPWWLQAPLPVALLRVPSLHLAPQRRVALRGGGCVRG